MAMTDSRSQHPGTERRVVTLLFADVVGSTTLAEAMDPEDWGEIVNEVIADMARRVERYGGTVAQFAGDSILALFGAPVAHEDDPYRAIRAGVEIVASGSAVAAGLADTGISVRVGINTGLVVVGDVDAGSLSVYSALGDAANVAARVQSLTRPGSVAISEDTYRLVSNDVEVADLGPTDLKGKAEPIAIYEVTGIRGFDERTRGIPGLVSPIVGRDDELAILRGQLTAAAAGTGRVVAVIGEPGVGKSRLAEELRAGIDPAKTTLWAIGKCVPYDDELPYHLVASLVRSLAGVTSAQDPDVISKAITDLAERAGAPQETDRLRRLVGLQDEAPDLDPETLAAEYAEALHGVVAGTAADHRPVVLVCEDVHWADASSVDLMSALLGKVPSTPVLLLLVMRPERESKGWDLLESARRQLAATLVEIALNPLSEEHSRALVANLLAIESLPPMLRRMVLDKAEGNPFFLEEVVRMLVGREVVVRRHGRWVAQPGIDEIDVPETLQGLLASRIDLLPGPVRHAGRVAAVIGREFSAGLLAEIHPVPQGAEGATLHPHVAELEAHGMVELSSTRPEIEFIFRHALIHDVMYEGLLKRKRKALHGEVADAIERRYPDRLRDLAPALARHHAEAGHVRRAISYLMTAGRLALARGARTEAHGFFEHAVELLKSSPEPDPSLLVEAAMQRAWSGMAFIPGPQAIAGLEEILPMAQKLGDPDKLAAVYVQMIRIRSMQGESYGDTAYREQLEAGYALVPDLTDRGMKAMLQGMMGLALRSADEYAASLAPLGESIDGLEEAGRLVDASLNASFLADSYSTLGRFADAESMIVRARDLGERSGDPNAVADADLIRGRIAAERGDLQDALVHTRRGLEAAEAVGNTFCTLAGNFLVADQKLRLGEVEEAITHLETSTGLAEYCNAGGYEALGQAWLAAARARLGDHDPREFTAPLDAAMTSGSRSGEALVRLHRAVAVASRGRPEEAFDDFRRAISLFSEYGGRPNEGRAHHAFAQALEASGMTDRAQEHFRAADQIFDDLGIRPDPSN